MISSAHLVQAFKRRMVRWSLKNAVRQRNEIPIFVIILPLYRRKGLLMVRYAGEKSLRPTITF